jgi:hypothetical protein
VEVEVEPISATLEVPTNRQPLAVFVEPDGRVYGASGGSSSLQAESTQDGWRQRHVRNLVVRLFRQHLARRSDLSVSYIESAKEHDKGVKALRLSEHDRSHSVLAPPKLTTYSAVGGLMPSPSTRSM